MSVIHNIATYTPTSTDTFFFDNNIWMYLFCPIGSHQKEKQKKYSALLKEIHSRSACIWINALVLSEFCNAWLRIEFDNWKKKPENTGRADYKRNFVSCSHYKETIKEIKSVIPNLLKNTERSSDSFNSISFDAVLSELENCDFNDSYYLILAQQNNWKIVTDDADFFKNNKSNVEIITANIRE